MPKPVYLDYAATTPVDALVVEKMLAFMTAEGAFGNPASLHYYGQQAKQAIEQAREQVALLLGAEPSEIIWTSGATEANNLAIKGVARLYERKGKHIITMRTEHKSILDPCQYLEKNGFSVTYLAPEANGLLDADKFLAAIRPDTILASIMYVNNETGIIQDIPTLSALSAARGILLHVDAVQAAGKLALNVKQLPIDLLSLSAHKIYGPKGIGALYLRKRPRVRVEPLIHGGGHEQGMRSGTLPTQQIVGMGAACELLQTRMAVDNTHIQHLRSQLLAGLQKIPNMRLTVAEQLSVAHILNVRFEGMLADAILAGLPRLATSTASACQGKGTESSYVLRALGYSAEQAKSAIRFSFGRYTKVADIEQVLNDIGKYFHST